MLNRLIVFTSLWSFLLVATLAWAQEEPFHTMPSEYPSIRVAIKALQEVTLSSQTHGTIISLPVADGAHFKKGDVLVEVDCEVLKAQVNRAKAQAKRQKLILDSNERLAKMQSKSALEVSVSRSEAEAAFAEAKSMEKMLEQCRIIAPFSGRVGNLIVHENQYVSEGQPLLEILDDSNLVLEFIVPSAWIVWFKPGYEFTFSVDETGGVYRAALDHLGGKVDPVSQSIKAYAKLIDPSAELIPGMSGAANLQAPTTNSTALPVTTPASESP